MLFLKKSSPVRSTPTHSPQTKQQRSPASQGAIGSSLTSEKSPANILRRTIRPVESDPFTLRSSLEETGRPSSVSSGSSFALGPLDNLYNPPNPYILAPKIVVTPESAALNDRINAVWVAIEVSTQLCGANGVESGPYSFNPGQHFDLSFLYSLLISNS